MSEPFVGDDITSIISRALDLTTSLDRSSVLQSFVESAVQITGAKYGALAILDSGGETLEFIYTGIPVEIAQRIGDPPQGHGVFGDIPSEGYLIVNDLTAYVHRYPWPDYHPFMRNFLGVPMHIHSRVYGRLYLADKDGGFTESDGRSMELLSRAAAIAVENSRLYAESNLRAQWIAASRAITTALLEGTDEEEALQLIAHEMRRVSRADVALIVLPSVGDTWACEFADGDGASSLIGVEFPPLGRAQTVIREGTGLIVDSMVRQTRVLVPELAGFGAALYAPMMSKGTPQGVIILLRSSDGPEFDLADLSMAENVARQAALALELASARLTQSKALQMEDRAQISRDLHDLAIQQLFASGMELSAVRGDLASEDAVPASVIERLDTAIEAIDESVSQIRQIIYSLRDPSATVPLVERLRREITKARTSLGYSPEFTLTNFGELIVSGSHTEIDDELGSDIADDVVAVVRECLSNTARHANANHVSVDIRIENHRVEVCVIDDGQGISPELSRRSGLSNLAARARRHHGTFSIRPGAGGSGTKVEWMAFVD
ncbi:GAF domain-containing protein [Arcanobacterium haemolyticum]|nr:GAF domain-containing protein [Arcanobacterium haemolyticum]